jgi:hypothetical protein
MWRSLDTRTTCTMFITSCILTTRHGLARASSLGFLTLETRSRNPKRPYKKTPCLYVLAHSCSLNGMISGERSSRLTTRIELVEVRELTESTDWFLPFHL